MAITHTHIYEKIVEVLVTQLCPTLFDPLDCTRQAPLTMAEDFPGKNTGVGCHPGDLPNPRIKPASSALAGVFFIS